jgi:hypothetical protein
MNANLAYVALSLLAFGIFVAIFLRNSLKKYFYKIVNARILKFKDCKVEYLTYVDSNTKCALLHHKNKRYVLLIGKVNNLLLDKYEEPFE